MAWFRKWQHFIYGKEKEPPSEVDNKCITVEKRGRLLLDTNSDYGEIPQNVWSYLLGQYQGGPRVPAHANTQVLDDHEEESMDME